MSEAEMPPAAIAGAVAAARGLLRGGEGEDAVLARMAGSALALAEAFLGQRLIVRAFEDRVTADGQWRRLGSEPVVAIGSGVDALDIDADGIGWVRAGGGGTATVAYTAGIAAGWDALPAGVAQGVALLVQHLFEHREGDAAPPAAIAALWRPWRRVRLAETRKDLGR